MSALLAELAPAASTSPTSLRVAIPEVGPKDAHQSAPHVGGGVPALPAPPICDTPHGLLPGRQVSLPGPGAVLTHYACGDCSWSFTALTAHQPKKQPRTLMSNIPVSATDTLTVLKLLAKGRDLKFVTAASPHLSGEQVREIAQSHGYPDKDKVSWAADTLETKINESRTREGTTPAGTSPAPVATKEPSDLRVILANARASKNKRAAKLADKILDDIARLRAMVKADEDKAAERAEAEKAKREARARVAELEKELAAAKAQLRGKPATASTAATDNAAPASDAAEIRSWAKEHGIEVPDRGRIPADVREQYEEAKAS